MQKTGGDWSGSMEMPEIAGYRLCEEIGRGGMGIVYRARNLGFERDVAIKVLGKDVGGDSFAAARFRTEARITGQLEHPGIPAAHQLGTLADGKPFLAMKLVRGATLKAMLDQRTSKRDERGKFIAIFERICHAMGYAHAHQVIHRDLKPSNVMVGRFGEVQIMDWGLAKVLGTTKDLPEAELDPRETAAQTGSKEVRAVGDDSSTNTGSVLGTPAYMPPEQASGDIRRVGVRSDVFGLGAILCEILTGGPPYVGGSASEIRSQSLRADVREASDRLEASGAEPELIALAQLCLSPKPEERPADGQAVANEVARIRMEAERRARDAELARSAALVREAESLTRRSQLLKAALVLGAVLVLGLLGTSAGILQARAAASAERTAKERAQTSEKAERAAKEEAKTKRIEATGREKEADSERVRAQQREQEAIDAAKRFGEVVSRNPELKHSAKLASLRNELLREPLTFFQSLRERLQAEKSTHPESLFQLASAALELGRLTHEIGDQQDAIRLIEEALEIHQRIALEDRAASEFQDDLAVSYNNLGILYLQTGKPIEALAALEKAQAIVQQRMREYPDSAKLRGKLADTHCNLGILFRQTGKPDRAIHHHRKAIELRDRLVQEDESVTEYRGDLAGSYNNLGILLVDMNRLPQALTAYQRAQEILERLVREDSTATAYAASLARIYGNLGLLFSARRQSAKALIAHRQSTKLWSELAQQEPSNLEFQNGLAESHNNLGSVLEEVEDSAKALEAYGQARSIQERLARENPSVAELESNLGGTLNNMAIVHARAKRFAEARDLLQVAIEHQLVAFRGDSESVDIRRYLKNHYDNLLRVSVPLNDTKLQEETERKLHDLAVSDPQFRSLDARLATVLAGGEAKNAAELLAFARRNYDLKQFLASAQFYEQALKQDPALAANRERPLGFEAACSAALAASGRGLDSPPHEDARRPKLRGQALRWLQSELNHWQLFLDQDSSPRARQRVRQSLERWREDVDLEGVRDPLRLRDFPESERKDWEQFWASAVELAAKVQAEAKGEAK